jgi:hypothetical protein
VTPETGVGPAGQPRRFQNQLGEADARLRAGRSLLQADADTPWATALASAELALELARIRASASAP